MRTTTMVGSKEERLLELLAEGGSTRVLARKLGHSEGTVRVYLHRLYKTIGVKNRTEAVLWHLHRGRAAKPAPAPEVPQASLADESFGDVALREGLLGALGIMESFIGPYGRVWQAGSRLKGGAVDAQVLARRTAARGLWRALLQGDFAYGKRIHDEAAPRLLQGGASPEGVLLALLLQLGGYSRAADQVMSRLLRAKGSGQAVSGREAQLLRMVRGVLHGKPEECLPALQRLAAPGSAAVMPRQVSMAALFHLYRAAHEADRARAMGEAIWAEAEAARSQLEAMGIRPLARSASREPRSALPAAAAGKATEAAR
jgi:DNA-binding CsgD family transcriptional regulator